MRIVELMKPFLGSWSQGVNRFRFMPTDEYRESPATASVAVTAGNYITLAYTWSEDGAPQDGLLLLAGESTSEGARATWVDSFHTASEWMVFEGRTDDTGKLRLLGSYSAGDGPAWGWEIHLEPGAQRMTMHNQVPGNDPYQVVELTVGH